MNQVAIVFGLIIASVVAVGAFQVMAPLVTNAENRSMEAEVINLITAARDFVETRRRARGIATIGTMSLLTGSGYLDSDLYSDGTGESVIGTNITFAVSIGTNGAVTGNGISYDAGDQESCNWLRDRSQASAWPDRGPGATAVACATGTLTIPIR